ncbi:MAG: endonuclease III [Chloroflexia bacterium]|nr:endonuclease III [Chloroflexia bacterium]
MHNSLIHSLDILDEFYGIRQWRPGRDAVDELVLTILSQNTTDRNSGRAFHELKRTYPSWHAVCDATESELAHVIRVAGLADTKAPRIQAVLRHLARDYGRFSLDFLAKMTPNAAQAWLTDHPGIGPKTAACVLLFAFGMAVVPVDTHIGRVAHRLGIVATQNPVKAQQLLEQLVPDARKYAFHMHFIQLGRLICHARSPQCVKCPLIHRCPSAQDTLATPI